MRKGSILYQGGGTPRRCAVSRKIFVFQFLRVFALCVCSDIVRSLWMPPDVFPCVLKP